MVLEMEMDATWSFRGGKQIVREKELLAELPEIAAAFQDYGGGNQYMTERAQRLTPLGWDQEVSVRFEAPNTNGQISRRASFDAYKDGMVRQQR